MAEEQTQSVLTDLPYQEIPVSETPKEIDAVSGKLGGLSIATGQVGAGQGTDSIGLSSQKNNEFFYVGNPLTALVLLGQLKNRTTVDEYGIWIGTTGQYLKYTATGGLIIYGGGIQAGNIHIPDIDTTDDSLHVDDDGNMWIGCTQTDFTASHKNAKAYILKTGEAYFQNTEINGILKTTVFQKDVVSAVGGQLIVSNSDVIDADMTKLDASTLTIKGTATLALNSILLIKDGTNEEWLRVTNIASAPTYTVARDLAGAYTADDNPAWPKGTAIVVMGLSDLSSTYSGGWLRLYGAGTNSPFYSVFARNGTAYNAYTEACRLGNLNGIGGKVSDCFGLFLGNYSTGKYLMYDDVSGQLIINQTALAFSAFFGDGSDGDVTISADTTLTSDMFYNNLTINAGKTLNTGGYRIFVLNTLTNNGTISRNGNNGGNASGSTAGTAGSALASGSVYGSEAGKAGVFNNGGATGTAGANVSKAIGVAGASGGWARYYGGTNAGGGAGSITGTILNKIKNIVSAYLLHDLQSTLEQFKSSAGSGSGASGARTDGSYSDLAGAGGGSGSSGGIVAIYARIIVNSGTISANGGNGGNGGNGYMSAPLPRNQYAYGGGGGAGGAGGAILFVYSSYTNSGTVSVAGGTGGTGGADYYSGSPNGNNGGTGSDGTTGTINYLQI